MSDFRMSHEAVIRHQRRAAAEYAMGDDRRDPGFEYAILMHQRASRREYQRARDCYEALRSGSTECVHHDVSDEYDAGPCASAQWCRDCGAIRTSMRDEMDPTDWYDWDIPRREAERSKP